MKSDLLSLDSVVDRSEGIKRDVDNKKKKKERDHSKCKISSICHKKETERKKNENENVVDSIRFIKTVKK
jgi:hypothetical protein